MKWSHNDVITKSLENFGSLENQANYKSPEKSGQKPPQMYFLLNLGTLSKVMSIKCMFGSF